MFYSKFMQKRHRKTITRPFLFFKQALYKAKASGLHFSFDILHPWLEHTIKSNSTNFPTNLQILRSNDVLNFDFSENDLGLVPSPHFMYNFSKKDVSHVMFLPKFHYPISVTSWDIGQYMYYNYLFSSLWRHKFWN